MFPGMSDQVSTSGEKFQYLNGMPIDDRHYVMRAREVGANGQELVKQCLFIKTDTGWLIQYGNDYGWCRF